MTQSQQTRQTVISTRVRRGDKQPEVTWRGLKSEAKSPWLWCKNAAIKNTPNVINFKATPNASLWWGSEFTGATRRSSSSLPLNHCSPEHWACAIYEMRCDNSGTKLWGRDNGAGRNAKERPLKTGSGENQIGCEEMRKGPGSENSTCDSRGPVDMKWK